MATPQLELPIPENLQARGFKRVEGDLYNICERIKEISPRLVLRFQENHPTHPWVVFENCVDGVQRYVSRYIAPDARILDDLRYMLTVPFKDRADKVQKEVDAYNEAREALDGEANARLAYEMRKALINANMADGIRGTY